MCVVKNVSYRDQIQPSSLITEGMQVEVARIWCEVARMRLKVARIWCEVARMRLEVARIWCEVARMQVEVARMRCEVARMQPQARKNATIKPNHLFHK